MRILRDRDGDLWVEVKGVSGLFTLPGEDAGYAESEEGIDGSWGPLTEMKLVEA